MLRIDLSRAACCTEIVWWNHTLGMSASPFSQRNCPPQTSAPLQNPHLLVIFGPGMVDSLSDEQFMLSSHHCWVVVYYIDAALPWIKQELSVCLYGALVQNMHWCKMCIGAHVPQHHFIRAGIGSYPWPLISMEIGSNSKEEHTTLNRQWWREI